MLSKQLISIYQDVIKVHRLCLPTTVAIPFIDLIYGRYSRIHIALHAITVTSIITWSFQRILCFTDTSQYCRWLICFVIELHLFDDGLHQTLAIRCIINGKVRRRKTYLIILYTKDTEKYAMKRTHPKITCAFLANDSGDTRLHFVCCFVGECESKDAPGFVSLF